LKTGEWTLINRKVEETGQVLVYSICDNSLKVLEGNQLRAFYKLGKVTFRVLKQGHGGVKGETS